MVVLKVDTLITSDTSADGGLSQLFFLNPSSDAQACADAVTDFWDAILPVASTLWHFTVDTTVNVYNETDGELLSVQPVTSIGLVSGTLSGNPIPPSSQGLIKLNTTGIRNNRLIRGRVFVPGAVEDANDSFGLPAGAYKTALVAAAQGLVDDATANWCVWSRPVAGSGGEAPTVVAVEAWDYWAVLRSRRGN
jgi:hypothetical protein